MDLNRNRFNIRHSIRRAGLFVALVYLWWGLPWTLMVSNGALIRQVPLIQGVLELWFFSVVVPFFPGTGLFAGYLGLITKDRLFSFLAGFLPNMLGLIILGPSSLAVSSSYGIGLILVSIGSSIGFGLIGFGASITQSWDARRKRVARKIPYLATISIVCGLTLWFTVVWVWPGSHAIIFR